MKGLRNVVFWSSGVLVPGGFGARGIEGKIAAIEWARTKSKPFLGICLGLQCAVIEFARHVLQYKDANSVEFDKSEHQVVIDMPEHNTGIMGGKIIAVDLDGELGFL